VGNEEVGGRVNILGGETRGGGEGGGEREGRELFILEVILGEQCARGEIFPPSLSCINGEVVR
jgi:hypothetical protein